MWFGRNRNRGFLFLFFACHCVPWFAVTIEVIAEDFFFFSPSGKCLFTNTITLYCTRWLKKNRGVGVLSEYGGSYSVVCVINIPAQTAQTAACTSVWLFSVTCVLTLLWHCWHMPPPTQRKRCKLIVFVDSVFLWDHRNKMLRILLLCFLSATNLMRFSGSSNCEIFWFQAHLHTYILPRWLSRWERII